MSLFKLVEFPHNHEIVREIVPGYKKADAFKSLEHLYIIYEGDCILTKKIIKPNAFERK